MTGGVVFGLAYVWFTNTPINVTPRAGETIIYPQDDVIIYIIFAGIGGGACLAGFGLGMVTIYKTILQIRHSRETPNTKR